MPPKISVVMPVYNGSKYLAEAIESILEQSFSDFEFLIINDASTDYSSEIVDKYQKQDERIIFLQNSTNRGGYFARNLGVAAASGEYITVMDQDDVAMPDRFEKQIDYLDSHPGIDVLGGQITILNEDNQAGRPIRYNLTPGGISWGTLIVCQLSNPTVMMRRKIFSQEGLRYREFKTADDYDLWTQLLPGHQMANLPDVLLKYRVHQANLSVTKRQIQIEETVVILREYIQKVFEAHLPEAQIRGLMYTRDIGSVELATEIATFLKRSVKTFLAWPIQNAEKFEICHHAAFKLMTIWKRFRFDPRALPILLSATILEAKSRWYGAKTQGLLKPNRQPLRVQSH